MKEGNKYCVYAHINPASKEIFYIGIGTIKRPYSKLSRSKHWHNVVNKYGNEIKILHENLSWATACGKEKEYIKLHGRLDKGTGILINKTDGGDGAKGQIGPWKNKKRPDLSKRNIGNKYGAGKDGKAAMTNEIKSKISEANKGKTPWNKGLKGVQKWTQEQMEKRINFLTGRKHSDETKNKMADAQKGKPKNYVVWNKGKKLCSKNVA